MTDKFQRISDIWNWLPAFRAVAETEHLPTASERVHVSTSALSRSVKRLEEYLGHSLFDRQGRTMQLNERGERLLRAVRRSMRRVDEAVAANLDDTFRGRLRWTSTWSLSGVTVEALGSFVERYSEVTPQMLSLEPDQVPEDLLQGRLDLAIVSSPIDREGLETRLLGDVPHSIYCGRRHPLFGKEGVGLDQIEGRRFAAPPPLPDGQYLDGWPPDRPREVVMQFAQMSVGFRVCRDQKLLAVLPDLVAQDEEGVWWLESVPGDHRAYGVYREPFNRPSPAAELAGEIEKRVRARPQGPNVNR
jgi:DNA-binding transcriptional LysR family regulator